jgi:hypothetical protein
LDRFREMHPGEAMTTSEVVAAPTTGRNRNEKAAGAGATGFEIETTSDSSG